MAERFAWFEWETFPKTFRWVEEKEFQEVKPTPSSKPDPERMAPYLLIPRRGAERQKWRSLVDTGHAVNPRDDVQGSVYLPSEPKHDKMFREFASTNPTQAEILTFANRYGHLGLAEELGWWPDDNIWFGESLQLWEEEIHRLRFCLETLDYITRDDREALSKHITWPEEWRRIAYYWPMRWKKTSFRWDEIPSAAVDKRKVQIWKRRMGTVFFRTHPQLPPQERPSWAASVPVYSRNCPFHEVAEVLEGLNVIAASWLFLLQVTNRQFERLGVRVGLLWDSERKRLCRRLVPETLLGFIWHQFSECLDVHGEPGECVVCGRRLLRRRAHAKTCGPTCRSNLRHQVTRKKRKEQKREQKSRPS